MSESDLEKMESMLLQDPDLEQHILNFQAGQLILRSGEVNNGIHLILKGHGNLEMVESETESSVLKVGSFGRGDFLGLASFWNQQPNVADSRALTEVQCLVLDRARFHQLSQQKTDFNQAIQNLFISNLSHRYRRGITLNRQVATLSRRLEKESNELKIAINDLEAAQQQLVSQEKLVTLGQLIAGLAHELNNPAAALSRNVEHLFSLIEQLIPGDEKGVLSPMAMVRAGADQPHFTPEERRGRMTNLKESFPSLARSVCRRLAQAPDDIVSSWMDAWGGCESLSPEFERALDAFELGLCLRSQRISVDRITQLVISLKNYSKAQGMGWQWIDIREGLRDTLQLLKYRLKNYQVHVELGEIPKMRAHQGQLNQVWTNLIVNAMEATEPGGLVEIRASAADEEICVDVLDEGCGIPVGLEERIFESEFSTRKQHSESGLGLGLTITRGIVQRHGGKIRGWNRPECGACFRVQLPVLPFPGDHSL